MEKFAFIKQCDLCSELEKDIIAIKQQHWVYSYNSQVEWMRNNLKEDDCHLLLYVDGQITAYLNLVNIDVHFDGERFTSIGIGNVCVAKYKMGDGYGRKIVLKANDIIKREDKIGVLLCKENLFDFYAKIGWHKITCKNMFVANNNYDKIIMLFNSPIKEAHKLVIDRNF